MFINNLGALKMEKRVFCFLFFFTVCCLFLGGWTVEVVNTSLILKKKSILEGKYFFPFPAELS